MLYIFRKSGKFGYVDVRGETIVPPRYREVGTFAEGKGWLVDFDDIGYLVDARGEQVCNLGKVEELGPRYTSGVLSFARNGKVGFFDQLGKVVVEPLFDRVGLCTDRLVVAYVGEFSGIYSIAADWVVKPSFPAINDFCPGGEVTTVCIGWNEGFIIVDRTGKKVSERIYRSAYRCNEKLIPVAYDGEGTYGWVDQFGETVVEGRFDDLSMEFNNGLIAFSSQDKWGLADSHGNIVMEPRFRSIGMEREGFRKYCENTVVNDEVVPRWGFLTSDGRIAIRAQFDGVSDFNGQAAIVYTRANRAANYVRDYFLINRQGEVIVEWS